MSSNLKTEQYGRMENQFDCSGYQPCDTNMVIGDNVTGLSSDLSLISCLVSSNYRSAEIVKSKLLEYIHTVSKSKVKVPTWMYNLVQLDKAAILRQLDSEPTMLSDSFLKVACYVFKLRLIIHASGTNGRQLLKFGPKDAQVHEVLLDPQGYFVLKDPSAKSNANPFFTSFSYKSSTTYEKASPKHSPIHLNTNPYMANRDISRNPNQFRNDQLIFLNRTLKLTKKTDNKGYIKTEANYLYSNYKQISDNSNVNLKKKAGRNLDCMNNLEDTSPRKPYYDTGKTFDEHVKQCSGSNKHYGSNFENLGCSVSNEKRNKGGNNTSLESAIEFITNYQRRLRQLSVEDLEAKQHKPSVINKTAHTIQGKLKFYSEINKFGFIEVEQGRDVFLHKDNLARSKINPKAFEQCATHFDMLMRFKVLQYQGKKMMNEKAVEIEILNFIPKS